MKKLLKKSFLIYKNNLHQIIIFLISLFLYQCKEATYQSIKPKKSQSMKYDIEKTEAEWKALLGEERYHILREKGTEYAFSGKYNLHFEKGTYVCGGCGEALFDANSKFDSHCGWPSFDTSLPGKVEYQKDTTHGMLRTEILCAKCGGHLGHVFDDGPTQTGTRYCVNSLSIDFKK